MVSRSLAAQQLRGVSIVALALALALHAVWFFTHHADLTARPAPPQE